MSHKIKEICNFVVKHSMVVFPVVVIAAVAVTVAIALGAGNPDESEIDSLLAVENVSDASEGTSGTETGTAEAEDVNYELQLNEDPALNELVASYYNALANGDIDTIRSLSNFVMDTEVVRIGELSKYIESYPVLEVYTKPGPEENSWVAYVYSRVVFYGYEEQVPGFNGFYVCTDENGDLYFNDGVTSEDVLEYFRTVSLQDDVVDLNNRVNAEYNEMRTANEALAEYINELQREVSMATGEALAQQAAPEESAEVPVEGGDAQTPAEGEADAPAEQELTGTATTTVNVRISDSEQADKLGKLSGGQQVRVLEQKPNGWSRVVFGNGEGYVKSEYLLVTGGSDAGTEGGAASGDAVRTATATTNVNLRSEASQSSTKLGTVIGGDTVEVLSESGEWSQVRYGGQVGYVKSEFLR